MVESSAVPIPAMPSVRVLSIVPLLKPRRISDPMPEVKEALLSRPLVLSAVIGPLRKVSVNNLA